MADNQKYHECPECIFVADREGIVISRTAKEEAKTKPKFFGNFSWLGCTGHLRIYIFKCSDCGEVVIDSPHGYTSHGLLKFICSYCGARIEIWDDFIYHELGFKMGPTESQSLIEARPKQLRKELRKRAREQRRLRNPKIITLGTYLDLR